MSELVPGEIGRGVRYSKKGDIATLPECMRYIDWLWEQQTAP